MTVLSSLSAADDQNPADGHDSSHPTVAEVLEVIGQLWPFDLTQSWDRTGLVVGRREARVKRILVAVDPVDAVVREAEGGEIDLLLTHHPLLLKGVHSVADSSAKGELVTRLIESRCALVTAHTNADQPRLGVSEILGRMLGLEEMTPLEPAPGDETIGIGRVGDLPEPTTLGAFAQKVAKTLPQVAGGVRVAGDPQAEIRTVALCGGAGDSLFDAVRASGADVYVTADLRHHPASEAREEARGGTPYLIDVSHFASEWVWVPFAAEALEAALESAGYAVEVYGSQEVTDPWDVVYLPERPMEF